jgi:YXWGXW repeat-containing protein
MRTIRFLLIVPAMLMIASLATLPASAAVSVGISVGLAPPPLPVYEQPLIPGPGYFWTPGYWAWGPEGYYWVPGTWVLPPAIGLYWTPPWWGWSDGNYLFHAGYWGPTVGFYGGIDYGFGYFGHGFDGGYWDHGRFFYNREVNNIRGINITNVFDRRVRDSVKTENRVAFNGGPGGISAQPTNQERAALNQRHIGETALQRQQVSAARSNRNLWASTNHGQPQVTATSRPGRFNSAAAQGGVTSSTRNFNAATQHGGPTGTRNVGVTNSTRNFNAATQHGVPTGTHNNFVNNGRNMGRTAPNVQGSPRNFSASTPRGPTQAVPHVTQPQPNRTFSQGAPSRFGAGRNSFVQHGPNPSFSRGAPAHVGAAPVARAPAANFARSPSGGGHPAGGHVAPAGPREHR